jgi:hypothetical protein
VLPLVEMFLKLGLLSLVQVTQAGWPVHYKKWVLRLLTWLEAHR